MQHEGILTCSQDLLCLFLFWPRWIKPTPSHLISILSSHLKPNLPSGLLCFITLRPKHLPQYPILEQPLPTVFEGPVSHSCRRTSAYFVSACSVTANGKTLRLTCIEDADASVYSSSLAHFYIALPTSKYTLARLYGQLRAKALMPLFRYQPPTFPLQCDISAGAIINGLVLFSPPIDGPHHFHPHNIMN